MSLDNTPSRDINRAFRTTIKHIVGTTTASSATDASPQDSESSFSHYTLYFITVPLITLLVVATISLIIHLLVRRHRSLYTHQLVPVFHYDPQEDTGWESELLDDAEPSFVRDSNRSIVRGTLNIESNGREAIKT